jgi:hypothetical protein
MISPNRKPVTVALATLIAGSVAQAQTSPQPRVFAAQAQTIQQQLNALKAQVTSLQTTTATLQHQVGTLQSQLAAVRSHPALALGPFVSVDLARENGVRAPNIVFKSNPYRRPWSSLASGRTPKRSPGRRRTATKWGRQDAFKQG